MAKLMRVPNRVRGDRYYRDDRATVMVGELLAATERGERDRCIACGAVAVTYAVEGPEDQEFVLAECSQCGWQGA